MSQKTKMSKQLRAEISISCQTAVFPALTKRAPHRMPRTGKMTNYIIFPPLNKDNHIPIPWLLLANQTCCERKGRNLIVSVSAISIMLAVFVEKGEKEKKIPSRNVITHFRLQHLRSKAYLPDYCPLRTASIVQVPH